VDYIFKGILAHICPNKLSQARDGQPAEYHRCYSPNGRQWYTKTLKLCGILPNFSWI